MRKNKDKNRKKKKTIKGGRINECNRVVCKIMGSDVVVVSLKSRQRWSVPLERPHGRAWKKNTKDLQLPSPLSVMSADILQIYFHGHFDTEEKCGLKHFTCKRTYCRIKHQEGKPSLFPYWDRSIETLVCKRVDVWKCWQGTGWTVCLTGSVKKMGCIILPTDWLVIQYQAVLFPLWESARKVQVKTFLISIINSLIVQFLG